MKKIYIAGKISGEDLEKCKKKFQDYIDSIYDDYYEDFEYPFHGLLINEKLIPKGTWNQYMRNDIAILIICDEIHMLPDWKDSKGAKIEHQLALDLGIKIVYVTDTPTQSTSNKVSH